MQKSPLPAKGRSARRRKGEGEGLRTASASLESHNPSSYHGYVSSGGNYFKLALRAQGMSRHMLEVRSCSALGNPHGFTASFGLVRPCKSLPGCAEQAVPLASSLLYYMCSERALLYLCLLCVVRRPYRIPVLFGQLQEASNDAAYIPVLGDHELIRLVHGPYRFPPKLLIMVCSFHKEESTQSLVMFIATRPRYYEGAILDFMIQQPLMWALIPDMHCWVPRFLVSVGFNKREDAKKKDKEPEVEAKVRLRGDTWGLMGLSSP